MGREKRNFFTEIDELPVSSPTRLQWRLKTVNIWVSDRLTSASQRTVWWKERCFIIYSLGTVTNHIIAWSRVCTWSHRIQRSLQHQCSVHLQNRFHVFIIEVKLKILWTSLTSVCLSSIIVISMLLNWPGSTPIEIKTVRELSKSLFFLPCPFEDSILLPRLNLFKKWIYN